jgi:phenylalanyl-tRNA synthetase beta chain
MKISVNWLKQFTDVKLDVDELVQKIGAQLGAVEEVIDLGKKYQGIIVAKVVTCEKHPNADNLSVCKIDDGRKAADVDRDENGYVQVVCGAPNVREGLTVAWLPPGSTVPATYDKDPFVLGKRELRGTLSNGMIASAAELAIGDDHNGIVELDTPGEPGTDFAEAYELNDHIIDIENKMFTHRPDCFGILGVAREVAGIQNIPFKSPDWYKKPLGRVKPGKSKLPLEVRNESGNLVPRFMALAMADVKMGPSPFIIQTYLSRVGLRPINNIVDVTNYLMVLTGQPLHAYDYDKVKTLSGDVPTLIARRAVNGEKLKLLNGKEIAFDDPAVLIATDKEPIGVGGVMGGTDTEVDENTKNIILECANFDMYSIRRTAMKYGLFTDAVTRFNKGQSPLQNEIVLEEAVETVQYVSGAHVASNTFDLQEKLPERHSVVTTSEFVNARLGLDLPVEDMARLLENVECEVTVSGSEIIVTPPFWRTDVEISEDIVEEVGRLYGFDHLPVDLPKRPIKPASKDRMFELKSRVRDVLADAGANEVLTYSFVHGNLLEKVGQDKNLAFQLSNALSPDLQYYRQSLSPSLLEKVYPNIKAGFGEFAIFEIGKSHIKGEMEISEDTIPKEANVVSLIFTADEKAAKSHKGAAFYMARKYLQQLLDLGTTVTVKFESLAGADLYNNTWVEQMTSAYDPKRSAVLRDSQGLIWGVVGEFKSSVIKSLKLPVYTAGFELDPLLFMSSDKQNYKPLSKFPKVEQDISLKVYADTQFQMLYDELLAGLKALTDDQLSAELTPLDIYQKHDKKHFTFRLTAAHYAKTLKAVEINELLDKLAERVQQKFGAERI